MGSQRSRIRLFASAFFIAFVNSATVEVSGPLTMGCEKTATCQSNLLAFSYTAPGSDYSLTQVNVWADPANANKPTIYGLELTFKNSATGTALTSPVLGASNISGSARTTLAITKKVTSTTQYGKSGDAGIRFFFVDGTSLDLGVVNTSLTAYPAAFSTSIAGFNCVFDGNSGTIKSLYGCNPITQPFTYQFNYVIADFSEQYAVNGTQRTWQTNYVYTAGQSQAVTVDGSTTVPNWMTIDLANQTLQVNTKYTPISKSDFKTYTITVSCSLSTFTNTATGASPYTNSFSTQFTFKSDCYAAQIDLDNLSNISITLGGSKQQIAAHSDDISNRHNDNTWCGTFTNVVLETAPYLSISGNTLTLATSSKTYVGTFTLTIKTTFTQVWAGQTKQQTIKITILDPCESATFQTSPKPFQDMNVSVPSTQVQTQSFAVLTDVQLNSPSVVCAISATISPSKSWIGISQTYDKIIIDPTKINLPTEIGAQLFTVTVVSTEFPTKLVSVNVSFIVYVKCDITSLTISTLPDTNYVLRSTAKQLTAFTITQTPACNYPLTLTNIFSQNGQTIATPSWSTFLSSTYQFTISSSNSSHIGTYAISTKVSLVSTSSPTANQNWKATSLFNLQILSDCVNTRITDRTFNDMTFFIGSQAAIQGASFADEVATGLSTASYCGARVLNLSPTLSFVSIVSSNVQVTTASYLDSGTYRMSLSVSLADYPAIPALTKSFKVTITCALSSIKFSTAPANTTLRVGVDTQPILIPFMTTQAPSCLVTIVFGLSTAPQFIGIVSQSAFGGSIQLSGVAKSNHGSYPLTLTATKDTLTSSSQFTITVIDPCSEAKFLTSPYPVQDMILDYPGTTQLAQTVTVLTDIQQNYNLVCANSLSLSGTFAFISLVNNQLLVDGSKISPTSIGVQTITFTATSTDFPSSVTQLVYSFKLTIKCTVTVQSSTYLPISLVHDLDQSLAYHSTVYTVTQFSMQPTICYSASPTLSMFNYDGSIQTPLSSFISLADNKLTVDTQDPTKFGFHRYLLTALVPTSQYLTGSSAQILFDIDYTVVACKTALLYPQTQAFQNIQYTIRTEAVKQVFLPFKDSVADSWGIPDICGPRQIAMKPDLPFIKLMPPSSGHEFTDPWSIVVEHSVLSDQGTYSFTITAYFANYPSTAAANFKFNVVIQNPCTLTKIVNQTIPDMAIVAGDPAVKASFSQFTDTFANQLNEPRLCGPRVYTLTTKAGQQTFLSLVVPQDPFIQQLELNLKPKVTEATGEFLVTITVALADYKMVASVSTSFKVIIYKPNHAPLFERPLPPVLAFKKTTTAQRWVFTLPKAIDEEGDKITIQTNLDLATSFIKASDFALEIDDTSSPMVIAGYFPLEVTLSDGKAKQTYKTNLLVFDAPQQALGQEVEEPLALNECQFDIVAPNVKKEVTYESGSMPLLVSWSRFLINDPHKCADDQEMQIKLSTSWDDQRFTEQSDWLQFKNAQINNENDTNFIVISSDQIFDKDFTGYVRVSATAGSKTASFSFSVKIKIAKGDELKPRIKIQPPVMQLTEVSESSEVRLEFNQPMIVFDQPNDAFMTDPLRFLQFDIVKNPSSSYWEDPNYIDCGKVLSAVVKQYTSRVIKVQLSFSNPLYISLDSFNRDQLRVTIKDDSNFISAIDLVTSCVVGSRSQISIYRQLPADQLQAVDTLQKNQKSLNAVITSSLPVNILLGLSLKYLWGMVNTLQVIIFMDEWKVNWPPNASAAVKTIRTIALGEFIDTKKMTRQVLDYYGLNQTSHQQEESSPAQRRLAVAAAQIGPRFDRIVILGFSVLFVVCLAIGAVILVLRSKYRQKLIDFAKQLYRGVFWNGIIRSYLQSFLKSAVTIAVFYFSIYKGTSKSSPMKITLMSLASLALFVIVPVIFLVVLLRYRPNLRLKSNKERFGSLYLGVRTADLSALLQVMEFLAFRFFFVLLTFTLHKVPGILVNVYMMLNNMHIIYLGWVRPFDTASQNKLELINSWLLHMVCYCLLLLANLMPSPQNEMNVGWAVIVMLGLIFLTNFGFMVTLTIMKGCRQLYLWKLKRDVQKRRAAQAMHKQELVEAVIVNPDSQRPIRESAVTPERPNRASISEMHLTTYQNLVPAVNLRNFNQNPVPFLKNEIVVPRYPVQQSITMTEAERLQERRRNYQRVEQSLSAISSVNSSVIVDDSQGQEMRRSIPSDFVSSPAISQREPASSHDSVFVSSYENSVPAHPLSGRGPAIEVLYAVDDLDFKAPKISDRSAQSDAQTRSHLLNVDKTYIQDLGLNDINRTRNPSMVGLTSEISNQSHTAISLIPRPNFQLKFDSVLQQNKARFKKASDNFHQKLAGLQAKLEQSRNP